MATDNSNEKIARLLDLLVSINNFEDISKVIGLLFSDVELYSLADRLEATLMLADGQPYSDVVGKTDISALLLPKLSSQLAEDETLAELLRPEHQKYVSFASVYDALTDDVDYKKRLKYIKSLFKLYGVKPNLVLDLACGTGTMTTLMAKDGFDMIGVDLSAEMLDVAKSKADKDNLNILYLNQPMEEFELYGTVDAALCLLDGLNYLPEYEMLVDTFKLVRNYLNPGGLFVFDINTKHKLKNVLAGNVFCGSAPGVYYTWENAYDPEEDICEFTLEFFIKDGEKYSRHTEYHYEKAYTIAQIKKALKAAGFESVDTYDDLTFLPPHKTSEKVFFVAK